VIIKSAYNNEFADGNMVNNTDAKPRRGSSSTGKEVAGKWGSTAANDICRQLEPVRLSISRIEERFVQSQI
jgi:hypothetical protein